MRYAILTGLALGTITLPAVAQQASTPDRDGVRRAALDYLEGFYEGDSTKIVRSVRPDAQDRLLHGAGLPEVPRRRDELRSDDRVHE